MDRSVAPVLHKYEKPSGAVNSMLLAPHIVVPPMAAIVGVAGVGFTVTITGVLSWLIQLPLIVLTQ